MMDDEPKCKRTKLNSFSIENEMKRVGENESNLTPIVSEDLYKPVSKTKVYVGVIKSPKDISNVILTLNERAPLKTLTHLKRVHKKVAIICPSDELKDLSIDKFVKNTSENLRDVFEDYKEVEVPEFQPRTKKQFEEFNKLWPCNFHPNKYDEQLVSGHFFTSESLTFHRQMMQLVLEVVKQSSDNKDIDLQCINAAVVVDPTISSVVAASYDNRLIHPLQHAAMLAIDNVARTQNGGAWPGNTADDAPGIDNNLFLHLKEKFAAVSFGAKKFLPKNEAKGSLGDTSEIGPYLCTGYDVYLYREPCIMCAMALVHARARRVFFCFDNEEFGGLKSKVKLQTVSSLNHHFEVFTGFI